MNPSTWSAFNKACGRPQRICWVVAQHEEALSICPLGWHMTTSHKPAMMAISVAPPRYTHDLIASSGECVLAWPGEELAEATMLTGTRSGRDTDKFAECDLAKMQGTYVKTPLVKECIANLECKVADQLTTGDHTIFALEVLEVWLAEDPGRVLCQVGWESGYEFLMEKGMYRFGVVKK